MKALILAGGFGTRLRPLSHTGPKQLIPVANKPVLHYILEDLKNTGITNVGIIVGYTEERIQAIKDSVEDGSKWGLNITYIRQSAPLGLAHAVYTGKEFLGEDNFVVYLGDNIIKKGIKKFVEKFEKDNVDVSLLLAENETPEKFGTAILNENNEIIDVEEKPEHPRSNLVITGVYLFKPCIFDAIEKITPGKKGELQITDAIKILVHSSQYKVSAHIIEDWWDDTGDTEAVLRANRLILQDLKHEIKGEIHPSVKIMPNVKIGENTKIEKNTTLEGPMIIGNNCKIGPNTYIGPSTSIGNNVIIKGGEIQNSVILDDCYIESNERIINSLIGKNVKIKSNSNLPKGHKLILGEHSEITL